MTRQISDRQCAIMLAISIVSLKLLILPALLSRYTVKYSYMSVICGLAIDFVFMIIMLAIMYKFKHLTFSEIIERSFGKVVRYLLNFILAVYFFFKGILIVKETHNYFNETLFENISWWFFVIPMLLLIFFIIIKDLKTISRSVEFFFWLIAAGIVLTILVPIKTVDFSNLLPIFSKGSLGIPESLLYCNFSFGDYFVLLMLMGRVDLKTKSRKKILWYATITNFLVVLFYIIFVAMFGDISVNQGLAISDMPLHSNITSAISRLDWIIIIIWSITLIFQAGALFSMSCACLTESFKFKNKYIPAVAIIVSIFITAYHYYLDLEGILELIISLPFSIITMTIQIMYPIILLIAGAKQNNNRKFKACNAVIKGQIKIQYTQISKPKKKKLALNFSLYANMAKEELWQDFWKNINCLLPLH